MFCTTVRCAIDLDRAVPLGLMVNELITNAIKHAFPEDGAGVITIRLDRGEELVLSVADNGSRAPAEPAFGGGLGTRLIEALAFISSEIHKPFESLFKSDATEEMKSKARTDITNRYEIMAKSLRGPFLFGAAFSVAQALYMMWAFMAEKTISGTTLTAAKLDGTTAAMTFTLDSDTSPAAITRAT